MHVNSKISGNSLSTFDALLRSISLSGLARKCTFGPERQSPIVTRSAARSCADVTHAQLHCQSESPLRLSCPLRKEIMTIDLEEAAVAKGCRLYQASIEQRTYHIYIDYDLLS